MGKKWVGRARKTFLFFFLSRNGKKKSQKVIKSGGRADPKEQGTYKYHIFRTWINTLMKQIIFYIAFIANAKEIEN